MQAAKAALQTLGLENAAAQAVHHALHKDADNDGTCIICLDDQACVVFSPCSHCVTCTACAALVVKAKQPCPLCRSSAVSIVS